MMSSSLRAAARFSVQSFCAPELWQGCILTPPCLSWLSSLLNIKLPVVMEQHADRDTFFSCGALFCGKAQNSGVVEESGWGSSPPSCPPACAICPPTADLHYGSNPSWAQLGDRNPQLPALWIKKLISSINKQLIVSGQYQHGITGYIFYKVLE